MRNFQKQNKIFEKTVCLYRRIYKKTTLLDGLLW